MNQTQKKRKKKEQLLLLFLLLIIFIALGVTIFFTIFYQPKAELLPDFMPIEEDELVEVIPEDEPVMQQTIDTEEEGTNSSFIVCSSEAVVHLDDQTVDFYYQNPASSEAAVMLQLWIDDTLIAKSGGISPGHQLSMMNLEDGVILYDGGYDGIVKVGLYDTETNEKVLLETTLEVSGVSDSFVSNITSADMERASEGQTGGSVKITTTIQPEVGETIGDFYEAMEKKTDGTNTFGTITLNFSMK